MNKRPTPLTWTCLFIISIVAACAADQTPKVFKKHLDAHPDIKEKYIYQSVLRLANIKGDKNFNKLIRDVRAITIYFPPEGDSTYQITELKFEMRSQQYEELIDFRSESGDRVSLWVNESLPKAHYVGLLDTTSDDYFFDIDGQLDLQYISALNVADQGALRDLIK
ncbi:MAG: DUF4252 domain-containing protein [Bacteroidota bacterium]|nr:DUF4252 domain-containing protein [Bacteroidota bacterium]